MRTISWISAACLLTVALHAQDAVRTQPAPPAPAHNTMLLTGCLVAGADDATFKLTNAVPNAQASTAQPQSVGTAGERVEYVLTAEKNLASTGVAPVELKRFVGRQVEITARSGDEPSTSAPTKAGEPTVAPDPGKPVEKKMRQLTVTAVKQVLATCR